MGLGKLNVVKGLMIKREWLNEMFANGIKASHIYYELLSTRNELFTDSSY